MWKVVWAVYCMQVWWLPNDEVTTDSADPDLQEAVSSEGGEQVEPRLQS